MDKIFIAYEGLKNKILYFKGSFENNLKIKSRILEGS